MKKLFRYYVASWIVLCLLCNAVVLLVWGNTIGLPLLPAGFWIAFALVDLSFVGQLVCVWFAFQKGNEELFARLPLVQESYRNLWLATGVGALVMAIPSLKPWMATVIALVLLALELRTVLKSLAAAALMETKAGDIRQTTAFVKTMTNRAFAILQNAQGDEEKQVAQEVYDTFRYSDPVSSGHTKAIEQAVEEAFESYQAACGKETGARLVRLMKERNELARQSKGNT